MITLLIIVCILIVINIIRTFKITLFFSLDKIDLATSRYDLFITKPEIIKAASAALLNSNYSYLGEDNFIYLSC